MKTVMLVVRRTHLYLALFCLPWFVMYGISSVAFSHPDWFASPEGLYDTSSEMWTEEGSWRCTLPPPGDGEIPRSYAAALVEASGLDADAFGAYRSGNREISVHFPAFFEVRRLVYRLDEERLFLYSREPVTQQVLTGMHARAGYQNSGFLNDAWAVMVDVVAVGFLLWVATGIVIWWQLPKLRVWGAATLLAGFLAFVVLVATL